MSSIDFYKKQAKQLVQWHREGNYSIAERIRMLQRFRLFSDVQALAHKFRLAEAQEIIAVENGYADWAALKHGVKTSSPVVRANKSVRLDAAIPILFVADVSKTAAFFNAKLGFKTDFLHGAPAFYGSVSRGAARLHLRFVHEPVFDLRVRDAEQLLMAFIAVQNAKELYGEFLAVGVTMVQKLQKEPWGGPSFIIEDLDGNRVCFSE